ncbi:Dam family site-specific DNA-(adenine-N6)-methyltransferase [Puniceicoccales bacterium CK1056]|uniref:Site-specific DNA-methyltransferase (adenine-specific) n=1 Tax=Oceanipulchritudo coccoides TaxID=2706888 RepID=A0A6B2LZM6_9BACT|nr:Dam family site-specific DNA-(adenine-N6)-methyltransferase [Oceanipulchritudo coccoides]NDV60970.1 Dam family site-specific DNA-(adenine-N6)-methyltransferase [Oceanipulchritudo coccoides]
MPEVIPFLKWAGGKRWLVSKRSDLFDFEARRYFEPFLGSGAVFFHLQPQNAIISDLNSDLIDTYIALRDFPNLVQRALQTHQKGHSKDYYYAIRAENPVTIVSRAARFLYLNRTCFNGLYRVNQQGLFNVPKGTKESVVLPTDNFGETSRVLQNVEINHCDFEETINQAREGDFIYVDPPYTVHHNTNNFIKYNEKIFSWDDQIRLAASLQDASQRGAYILISNADHNCIHELYAGDDWSVTRVYRHSRLAGNAQHRRDTSEVVISNYEVI